MVGGLERSALFSACKATRSAVRLLESTNLRVGGQVGIYNEEIGACIDVLCALTGLEFVRVSRRRLAGYYSYVRKCLIYFLYNHCSNSEKKALKMYQFYLEFEEEKSVQGK